MPDVKFFCDWDQSQIKEAQDITLLQYARDYSKDVQEGWTQLANCMSKYPEIFQESSLQIELFKRFYAQVCTRCFGWSMPTTAMIPVADNFNHSNVQTEFSIFHKKMHLECNRDSQYFTKTRFMNDFSLCYDQSEYNYSEQLTKNVQGHYNKGNFEANKKFSEVESIKAAIDQGIELWNVPCIRETFTEDNDTTESEESEEEEEEQTENSSSQV